jgi:hypothetical protein
MKEKFDIDIRLHLIIALGSKTFLHSEIDEIYRQDELKYYNAYKESVYYKSPIFSMFTTMNAERMHRVAGIVQADYNNNSNTNIFRLIKKGYKAAWNYVKSRDLIDINDFLISWLKRNGGMERVAEIDIFNTASVLIYLCLKTLKKYSFDSEFKSSLYRFFTETQVNCHWEKYSFNDEAILQHRKEIDELYMTFHIPKKNGQLLDSILSNINVAEIKVMPETRLTQCEYSNLSHLSFKRGISRYIGALSGWFKTLGINNMDIFSDIKVNVKDLDKLFLEYLIAKNENNIPEENKELYVIATLYIQCLAKEYKKTKDVYLNDCKETMYYNLTNLQNELAQKEDDITKRESKLINEKLKLEEENKTLQNELEYAKRQIVRLEGKLVEKEKDQKELLALREYMFSLEDYPIDNEETKSAEDIAAFFKDKRCAIVGGNPNWIKKMKLRVPSFIFIGNDNRSKDLSFLDHLDIVFFNTEYNSHSIYEKVIERMRKNKTKMVYINRGRNVKESLYKMFWSFIGGWLIVIIALSLLNSLETI